MARSCSSRAWRAFEIYTHEDRQAHRDALGRISEALGHGDELLPADQADDEPPAGEAGGE